MYMEEPTEKVYYGLPITSITMILPAVVLLELVTPDELFPVILIVMLFVVGTCFILNFKIHRPGKLVLLGLIVLTAVVLVVILRYSDYTVVQGNVLRHLLEELDALH